MLAKEIRFFLVFFILVATCKNAAAQEIEFKHLTINDGLSQNTVNSIIQDKKGIIWIATMGGLNKFNGYDFFAYTHNEREPNSLSHNRVNVVFEDSKGNLWVGTDGGLNLFNPLTESFTLFKSVSDDTYYVYSISEDKDGTVWVGTQQGLKFLDKKKQNLLEADINLTDDNKRVQYVHVDRSGLLWLGLAEGLRIYDPRKHIIVRPASVLVKEVEKSWIRAIKQGSGNDLWLATENDGVLHYKATGNTVDRYTTANGLLSNIVKDLIFENDHTLWIGTKMGVSILNLNSGKIQNHTYSTKLNPANSLSHPSVKCLFKDSSKNIWIGTYSGGINLVYNFKKIFSNKGIKTGDPNPLSNKEVHSILGEDNHSFWIATDGGGLNYWNKTSDEVKVFKYRSKNSLYNFIKDIAPHQDSNKLWIGTAAGMLIFNKATSDFKRFPDIQAIFDVEYNHNYSLLNTPRGLWIGTNYNGLHLIDDEKIIKSYTHQNSSLNSNSITALALDSQNDLWVGHLLAGLNRINLSTGKVATYTFNINDLNSLSDNSVSCLFKDSKNRMWVGTAGGGLNYYDDKKGKFFTINTELGLSNNTIHSIEEDNKGALWVSTNKGIFKIVIKSNLFPLKAADLEVSNYTVLDGLQSNQFIQGSSYKSKSGELFFGGINGVNSLFPDKIAFNEVKPSIIFTGFTILNQDDNLTANPILKKPIDYLDEITLAYDETYFTIRYAALNYIYPERNTYAYKLDGFRNDGWQYVKDQRFVTYTGLDPGTYTFRVKAANNSGVWSAVERTLKIVVLPPWYQTYWAYAIYGLIFLALLYIFNYYSKYTERLKNSLKYEADLNQKEQELSQKKLSFFINISHEIKTPITMIMAPLQKLLLLNEDNPKTTNYLNLMNKSGQRLLNLIDQLLDLRKFDANSVPLKAAEGNLVRFTKEIAIVFSNLAKNKDIEIEFYSEQQHLTAWFDRDKLEKVLYNIISNAIKYTSAFGKIKVEVSTEIAGGIELAVISVFDNGCGIAQDRIDNLFLPFQHVDSINNNVPGTGIGLAFAKELMELHHGSIHVSSRAAESGKSGSTCFSVKIPVGKSYLSPAEIDLDYLSTEDISNYKSYDLNQRTAFSDKKTKLIASNGEEKFTMLLVEDNPDVLNFLLECFENDFEIKTAGNGSEGYDQALEDVPDIVISDVMMPVMDGIELCSKLKGDILTSHIPIILLTARSPHIFKLEGLDSGADEYITKPFNFELLEVKVWNLLENRQKMRARYQKQITLQPTNASISTFDDKFIEKVMGYVEDNIAEDSLNVENLSAHVGMSRGNLYKKLKALTSKSPVEFIRHVRIKRAAQLLKQHKMYVNEVAFMVGFQDVTYFRKCFKDEFGVTPTEFSKIESVE